MTGSGHRWLLAGIAMLGAAGCQRRPAVPVVTAAPHYTVGIPWQGTDGIWFYPREQFDLHQTGLAVIEPTPARPLTADGERYDPGAVAGAHQTLQLPAMLRVTNLENGRGMLVRINDRGPTAPGRLLGLTPTAARYLGMVAGAPARIAIDLDPDGSRAVAAQVAGGPHLDIASAPVQGVQEQPLGVPGQPDPGETVAAAPRAALPTTGSEQPVQPLPITVQQGVPDPGSLWIDVGHFGQRGYADQLATATGGTVDASGVGRETVYRVRIGPFGQVAAADEALDRAHRAGVTGARIIVE